MIITQMKDILEQQQGEEAIFDPASDVAYVAKNYCYAMLKIAELLCTTMVTMVKCMPTNANIMIYKFGLSVILLL